MAFYGYFVGSFVSLHTIGTVDSVTVPSYTLASDKSSFFPNFTFANPFVLEYQQKFKSFSVAPGVNTILPESMLPTQKST